MELLDLLREKPSILLVENRPQDQVRYLAQLRRLGFNVHAVESAEAGLRAAHPPRHSSRFSRRAVEPKNRPIYVVDDDDSAREMQDFILRREGFTIDNFPAGVEAVQTIRNKLPEAPDLVVLDLMLPLKSGVEIIHALQEQEEMRGIPVVVVTGRRMDAQLIDEMRLEPNIRAFLSKPFRSQDLTQTAHQILKTRKTGPN